MGVRHLYCSPVETGVGEGTNGCGHAGKEMCYLFYFFIYFFSCLVLSWEVILILHLGITQKLLLNQVKALQLEKDGTLEDHTSRQPIVSSVVTNI